MRNLTFILILIASSLGAQPYKIMTFNIRYDNPGDGVNQWDMRKSKVFALIEKHNPDIIGVQEALHHQLKDIAQALDNYQFFGAGRDDGKKKGEFSAIFVRTDRFKVLDESTFWLSKTPDVPGSKDWDAAITRVATWGRLQDKKNKQIFVMMNTHFDHVGKESRKNSATILIDRAASISGGLPVIITGDFNFTRDKAPYAVMTQDSGLKLIDAAPGNTPGTACGFVVDARPCVAIDYIFHSPHWTTSNYQVIQDNDGKYYPSDHLPVVVTLSLTK